MQLDLTGPAQFFSRTGETSVHLVWKTLESVMTDAGFAIVPTNSLASCLALDLVCVPSGAGQLAVMGDAAVLEWLRKQGATAHV